MKDFDRLLWDWIIPFATLAGVVLLILLISGKIM